MIFYFVCIIEVYVFASLRYCIKIPYFKTNVFVIIFVLEEHLYIQEVENL